ncbi:MAG: hypothetical protein P4L16_05220 [Chlamydiales bacterium]|nr:hypothetical protein [Chlamydiales bacterium]
MNKKSKLPKCLLILILLCSCQVDESHPISRFEREERFSEQTASLAFDPSTLTPSEQALFTTLSPGEQNLFSTLDEKQRAWATELITPLSPDEAVWKAAMQEILEESLAIQDFYKKLDKPNKILFLILDDDPTKAALNYAEDMSPNHAVHEALQLEIDSFPSNLQAFIHKLPFDKQLLFLSLSDATQSQIFRFLHNNQYDLAVTHGAEIDIQRLPKNEQSFIKQLPLDLQTLFLSLPPESRWMAIALTKKLDFNLALQYAASIQTVENPST